jgi:hypothetical protein
VGRPGPSGARTDAVALKVSELDAAGASGGGAAGAGCDFLPKPKKPIGERAPCVDPATGQRDCDLRRVTPRTHYFTVRPSVRAPTPAAFFCGSFSLNTSVYLEWHFTPIRQIISDKGGGELCTHTASA